MTCPARQARFSLILVAAVFFFISGPVHSQTSDLQSKATGSISGRVTVGGKPAFGITVAAFGGDFYPRRSTSKTTTDSDGRYRLFGLAPATYQVTALAPNLAAGETNNNPYGVGKMVLLSASEAAEDVDFKLVRGAVITGRITDEEGKPVVEERVNLELVSPAGGPMQQMSSASYLNSPMYITDDRGIYRIYGLAAGRYKVSVGTGNGGFPGVIGRGRFAQAFYGDTNDKTKAAILDLSEGSEASNIDIKVGHRGSTFSIAGRVLDSDNGAPVAGVRLTYGRISPGDPGANAFIGGLPTNARGEFRFDGLETGHYTAYVSSRFDGGDFYSDPIVFDLVDRDVTNLEVKALHGLTLSGVVIAETESGQKAMRQQSGLRLTASVKTTTNQPSGNGGSAEIGADGSFNINGVPPGRAVLYLYSMTNTNSRRFSMTRVESDGVDLTMGFDLQAGRSMSNLRVFVSYGTGTIRGAVRFENGTAPPDARIFVGIMQDGKSVNRGTMVDTRGHFLITDLPPGNYEVILNVGFSSSTPAPPPRPRQPLKQFVTVADDAEVEVNFTVDLKPKEGGP
jgi:protocatechuate 3,4-dioxygenase beta subunit